MIALAGGVLAASLLGSVHCAAMCGAFTCLYAGTGPGGGTARAPFGHHAAYNLGRLASYLLLGLGAGALGTGLGRAAAPVAAALLLVWGGHALLVALGTRLPAVPVPAAWRRAMGRAVAHVADRPPATRAAVTGLVTTLLPCGWLWAFAAVAAGTGSLAGATLVMTAFWLGTLPMMLAVALGVQRLAGRYRARLPLVSAALVLCLGTAALLLHLGVLPGAGALHRLTPAVVADGTAPHASHE